MYVCVLEHSLNFIIIILLQLQERLSTSVAQVSETLTTETGPGDSSVEEYHGTMKVTDGVVWTSQLSDKTSAEYDAMRLKLIAFVRMHYYTSFITYDSHKN